MVSIDYLVDAGTECLRDSRTDYLSAHSPPFGIVPAQSDRVAILRNPLAAVRPTGGYAALNDRPDPQQPGIDDGLLLLRLWLRLYGRSRRWRIADAECAVDVLAVWAHERTNTLAD